MTFPKGYKPPKDYKPPLRPKDDPRRRKSWHEMKLRCKLDFHGHPNSKGWQSELSYPFICKFCGEWVEEPPEYNVGGGG